MVAYLEKTDGNTEFHQIMDFLTRSSIYYALTVSPIVSTSFVEQFWTTAKSRTVNNISYIDATVAGKPVTISEASIRSDLLFDDADGIDSLNNQAIFDNIQLMGYEGDLNTLTFNKALFSPQWKFLFHTMNHCISSKSTSWDQIPTNIATARVLVGIMEVTYQANEIKLLKAQIKKLKKKAKPVFTHHKVWMKSVALKTRLTRKNSLKKKGVQKGYVSKQGRKSVKSSKGEPSMHKDLNFEDLDDFVDLDDTLDYMETKDDQDEGRTSSMMLEKKESADKEVSTEAPVSIVKPNEGTDKRNEGTEKQDGGTDNTKNSTDRQGKGTADQNEGKMQLKQLQQQLQCLLQQYFGDDETIAQVLIIINQNKQKEKEKGVEIRNVEDTERPRPTSTRSMLTLKPLPKIDPKDKGKKMIDEESKSDTESDDITEAEKKFKMLAKEEEVAKKVQEEYEAEEEKKRLAEEEATKVALTNDYDFIHARINADKILTEELQKDEREKSEAIRNKPPIRNQLRNQMMTYLKHVGGKKHSDLKTKTFEEIQVLYERLKRQDQNFVAIGSAKDERQIKELNKDPKKKRVIKETPREEDTAKVPAEQEVTEQGTKKRKSGHVKMIARKRPRPQPDDDSDDEHRKCLRIVTFDSTIDSEIMETKSFIARLHKVSSPDGNYLVVYRVNGHFRAFNYLMEVLHNRKKDEKQSQKRQNRLGMERL
ncbi:hypothetical protein Tco_0874259 [Tanacetum coccineum]|uniref:Xylulose kinase-1 n=1 Tax=Tanacetum coccineum TaxID=301880 RepID=A0ABQ5BP24_9ASTR